MNPWQDTTALRQLGAYVPANTVHYLLPSIAVAVAFGALFVLRHKRPLQRVLRVTGTVAPVVVPRLLAATTFLAGSILIFSGATPAAAERLGWLVQVLPLPVIEVSHFFGSLAGAGLLILARGLWRRLDAAYSLTVVLLGAGALFCLLKELDVEEAVLLAAMLGALVASRRFFYRKASLFEERFTAPWIAAIGFVVVGSVVLGVISYGWPDISAGTFWRFSPGAEAPRFLRATTGVVVVLVLVAGTRLITPARARPGLPTLAELDAVAPIVAASPEAAAHLAFLGDKALLFNAARTGFVMYAVARRSWVALGDPVAPPDEVADLALRFITACDRHGAWPVFYKVGTAHLHRYLDIGFSVAKLGEEARVQLGEFSLDGAERRNLRRVWRTAVNDGCSFEMLPARAVEQQVGALRVVSDAWLEAKHAREKRFSLGFFDDDYVRRFPTGIVRRDGRIIAFANAWPSGCHEEIEVDLMRFTPGAPPGIMRYALSEMMLWGKAQGYRWFNLGMAPLSGLTASTIAPIWHRLGTAAFGHGERFYNFQGVREFKEWFHPVWVPKYLVSPGAALRPVIMANIASLVAGGLEGVVRR
ncbi:MAG TPA: bifunctional lysylphosphatidylglycerol flippase/synthetase MprF [Gemmatimonadaceae bacterium]|nr:bifunctional lysylphosphatidylglycerol flippase/synthetase MprF [Gemmatimonadaceae bacterium]